MTQESESDSHAFSVLQLAGMHTAVYFAHRWYALLHHYIIPIYYKSQSRYTVRILPVVGHVPGHPTGTEVLRRSIASMTRLKLRAGFPASKLCRKVVDLAAGATAFLEARPSFERVSRTLVLCSDLLWQPASLQLRQERWCMLRKRTSDLCKLVSP